jgi:hypothetical protein
MLLVDVIFKSLVGAATVDLLVISDADAAMSYRLLVLLVLPTTAGWLLALALLLRPIERWARAGADASDSQIIAAVIATHRTPHRFALIAALTWLLAFGPLVPLLRSGIFASVALPAEAGYAVSFQCGAFVFGAYVLCSALTARLLGRIAERISNAARDRGLTIASGGLSIHRRLVASRPLRPVGWRALRT